MLMNRLSKKLILIKDKFCNLKETILKTKPKETLISMLSQIKT